jgi:hypothetical protein
MSELIRIRDVVRGDVYELSSEEPALRSSYDLFHPGGPVHIRDDGLAEWREGERLRAARVAPATLGDIRPGERILVRLEMGHDWWLCDVEAVDGLWGDE